MRFFKSRYGRYYLLSLAVVLALSAYPLFMCGRVAAHYLRWGSVGIGFYPKYVIPYAPVCLAVLLAALAFPLLYRLAGRRALRCALLLGTAIFLAAEGLLENVKVGSAEGSWSVETWQLSLCMQSVPTPLGIPLYAKNNPAFKLHFYLIALLIVWALIVLIHGYGRVFRGEKGSPGRPLILQTVSTAVFVALCVLACFTAFFRDGNLRVSPLTAILMGAFFLAFGATAGALMTTLLCGRGRALRAGLPAAASLLTVAAMYLGEWILLEGRLYLFGEGFFFSPLGGIVLSPCDLAILAASGVLGWQIARWANRGGSRDNSGEGNFSQDL